jgi:tight adherence protein B
MTTLMLITLCTAGTFALLAYAVGIRLGRRKALLADRLETYAGIEEEAALATDDELRKLSTVPRLLHVILGRNYMQNLEDSLSRADIPMRPSEYILVRVLLAGMGFIVGMYGLGYLHSGVFLMLAGYFIPAIFVRVHQQRRRNRFVTQLADALMLLTNSLRSGYGFLKGLELVAKEMGDPISKELNRMLREVNLGATVEQAMLALGRRVNSPDLDIVISAYLIQKDVGGNLTEIMEKVAETIRERIRIHGDIRVLTAQGRLSGLIVGALPFGVGLFFWLKAPDYFAPMFGPPTYRLLALNVPVGVLLLLGAFFWQLVGAFVIYKIIDIKV